MKKTTLISALFALGLAASASAQQMNFQGRLTDNAGAPRPGPQATLTFSIWDAPTAGAKIWGDFALNADLIDGRFSVKLGNAFGDDGQGNLLSSSFAGPRYIQIQVGTDAALPRQEVLAAPTALNAVTVGASQYKLGPGNRPTIGSASASGFTFNGTTGGLLLETGFGESSGLFLNRNTAALYSPGNDGRLFSIYDEDDLDQALETEVEPQFFVRNNGGFNATGTSEIGGNLTVTGNVTAGTISGTLSTPDLTIPGTVGIGIAVPSAKLHVTGGTDASLSSNGFIVNGPINGSNLVLDDNEVQARFNGGVNTLYLNNDGGNVIVGNSASTTTVPGNLNVSGTVNGMKRPHTISVTTPTSTLSNPIYYEVIPDSVIREYFADAEGGRLRIIATRASDGYVWCIDETIFINPTTGKGYTTQMGGSASAFTLNGDPTIENIIPVPYSFITIQDQDRWAFGATVGSVYPDLRLNLIWKGNTLGVGGTIVLKFFDD